MLLFYIIFGDRNPPYLALGSNIPSARRPGQRFHFLQCRRSSPSLHFVNRHGGQGGLPSPKHIHEGSDAFTSDFCNNYSHPASPASLYLTSPRPRPKRPRVPYLMSSSPSSRVPKSQVLPRASRCPRPTFIHSRLRCVVDAKFSRWRRRSRNFAGYMLCFSIDVFLSLDRFSQFHKLIFV